MVKNQLSFHWYFGNKICIGKNTTRISLVNNQQKCKNNLKLHGKKTIHGNKKKETDRTKK